VFMPTKPIRIKLGVEEGKWCSEKKRRLRMETKAKRALMKRNVNNISICKESLNVAVQGLENIVYVHVPCLKMQTRKRPERHQQ
jgi:predicted metal-binding protein